MRHSMTILAVLMFVAPTQLVSGAQSFFQPDSATASSEWSSNFLIDYTIDGSGMPADFGPEDEHGLYSFNNNHWTTGDGDVAGAWARFLFDDPVTIDTFWMWNHRSTTPPAFSTGYAVTLFDLAFYDGDDQLLAEHVDLTAVGDLATAQVFTFDLMDGVRSVLLTIHENDGEPRVTGLAEVAFGVIPEPASLALLGVGAAAVLGRRRRG